MKYIYKITNTLAVLSLIPVLLFLPMFRFIAVVDTSGGSGSNPLMGVVGSLLGGIFDINAIIEKATGINIENLPEFYTIPEAYNMFLGDGANEALKNFDFSLFPEAVINYFTAAGVLFAVALLFAVLALISGIFTKKKFLTASFSALGFITTFAASKCFTYIAEQFVSGKISVVEILSKVEALANYEKYLEMLNFDIRIFELSSAYTMMLVIFGAIILLNIGFRLADSVADV